MQLFVGTSGYGYKEWKGSFYPEQLPAKRMLTYYGERFNSVELNHTFRKMPTAESLKALAEQVPEAFRFAVKAPQSITHFKRLKDTDTVLKEFTKAVKTLKERQGPVLFQLPPNFKKDLDRLKAFLKILDKKIQAAFEFRHESWYDDEVIDALRARSCVLCAADDEETPPVQVVRTADWGYVRLRRDKYTKKQLATWVQTIRDQNWKETFVYFKHEETGTGPRWGKQFLKLAGQ